MTLRSVDTSIRVRYAETDAQGVVYHANHIVYFEVGRGAFLRSLGLDYRALEAAGTFLVVVEAQARYTAPAHYDDELVFATTLASVRHRSLSFSYVISRGEVRVAEGRTAHVAVNAAGKPVSLPAALRAVLVGEEP